MDIGQEIKCLREEKDWTQTQLAYHAETAPSSISLIENGQREPNLGTLRKLAQALDVELVDLVGEPTRKKALALPEPTEEQKAAPLNYATRWIDLVNATSDVGSRVLSRHDASVDEALEVSRQMYALISVGVDTFELIYAWCDEDKQRAFDREKQKFIEVFDKLDELIKEELQELQGHDYQEKLAVLNNYRAKREELEARAVS